MEEKKKNRSREEKKKKRHKRLHNCADTESVIEVDSRRNYRAAFPPPSFFFCCCFRAAKHTFISCLKKKRGKKPQKPIYLRAHMRKSALTKAKKKKKQLN